MPEFDISADEIQLSSPDFAALMTNRQFDALAQHIEKENIIRDLQSTGRITQFKQKQGKRLSDAAKWLSNGWSTEQLLRLNAKELDDEHLSASVHWAFPQAYYSVYTVALGFFRSLGLEDNSHRDVRNRVGEYCQHGSYPQSISVYADGGLQEIRFENIEEPDTKGSSLEYDRTDGALVRKHICQFLRSTRETDLKDKREDFSFKTKDGRDKKQLSRSERKRVSDRLGPTTILDLLYRKRIKANYRDVATYQSEDLKTARLLANLVHVVSCLNFVHEAYTAAAHGQDDYRDILKENASKLDFVEERWKSIKPLL